MSKFAVSEKVKTPWLKNRGDIPATIDYFDGSMWDKCESVANQYPDLIAYDFMGSKTTYKEFKAQVEECAKALKAIGIKEDDKVFPMVAPGGAIADCFDNEDLKKKNN